MKVNNLADNSNSISQNKWLHPNEEWIFADGKVFINATIHTVVASYNPNTQVLQVEGVDEFFVVRSFVGFEGPNAYTLINRQMILPWRRQAMQAAIFNRLSTIAAQLEAESTRLSL